MKILIQGILFLSIVNGSYSALPACTTTGCPPEGIWSEWATTQNCTTSCGSCSKAYFTRTCLTEPKCNCTGVNSRYFPCNTKPCVYPAQRACCLPYVPMVLGGYSQCGPFPKEPSLTSCCPTGGIWSDWSGFVRNEANTGFEQTRRCLSEGAGCPCTGNSVNTTTTCPCRGFDSSYNSKFTTDDSILIQPRANEINSTTCIYRAELDDENINCSSWTKGSSLLIRMLGEDNEMKSGDVRMAKCDASDTSKKYVLMYCDFTALEYRLYNNNWRVTAWSQVRKVPSAG